MNRLSISILVFTCFAPFSGARAATMSFDGNIERNPYSYDDPHTLDFITLDVLSPGNLVVVGTGGTLLDLGFGVYVLGIVADGRQRLNLAPNLTYVQMTDNSYQIVCGATPGRYVIGVDPGASDWDTMEGIVPYFSSDGEPEFANGSYHLEITGDFSLVSIHEGNLPGSIPEPTGFLPAIGGLVGFLMRRRTPDSRHG